MLLLKANPSRQQTSRKEEMSLRHSPEADEEEGRDRIRHGLNIGQVGVLGATVEQDSALALQLASSPAETTSHHEQLHMRIRSLSHDMLVLARCRRASRRTLARGKDDIAAVVELPASSPPSRPSSFVKRKPIYIYVSSVDPSRTAHSLPGTASSRWPAPR